MKIYLEKIITLIETETLIDGRSQEYEYDAYGNVTKKTIKSSNNIVEEEYTYTYDTLFRLTEEEIVTYSNNLLDDLLINKCTYYNNGNRISVRKEENGTLIGKKVLENNVEITLIYNYNQQKKIKSESSCEKPQIYVDSLLFIFL